MDMDSSVEQLNALLSNKEQEVYILKMVRAYVTSKIQDKQCEITLCPECNGVGYKNAVAGPYPEKYKPAGYCDHCNRTGVVLIIEKEKD
jgi:hypothetical protein